MDRRAGRGRARDALRERAQCDDGQRSGNEARDRAVDPARRQRRVSQRRRRADEQCAEYTRTVRRTSRAFLGEPFRGVGRQGAGGGLCGRVRTRRDPPARARPFRGHAGRRRTASRDAAFPRPGTLGRPRQPGRAACRSPQSVGQTRAQRESRARNHGTAHARRTHGIHAGRRDGIRACADRLEHRRRARAAARRCGARCIRVSPEPARTGHAHGDGPHLRSTGRSAGTRDPARPRAFGGNRPACRVPAGPPFRRRQSATCADRPAGPRVRFERRRSADRLPGARRSA